MRPRRCVETCQKYLQAQRKGQSYILFACRGVDYAGRIHDNPRRNRVCGRFRSKHAHGQQERPEESRILEIERISKNPTVVVTAKGEVLTKEEATVYVRELDLFVTAMLLENTLAVLSLGKLCEEIGYRCHWTSGQKPHFIKKSKKFHCGKSNHVPFVVPGYPRVPLLHQLLQHLHHRKL